MAGINFSSEEEYSRPLKAKTNLQIRKLALIDVLRKEKERLPSISAFGTSNNKQDYDKAIKYLETGEKPRYYDDSELLSGLIDDFETFCNDYGV